MFSSALHQRHSRLKGASYGCSVVATSNTTTGRLRRQNHHEGGYPVTYARYVIAATAAAALVLAGCSDTSDFGPESEPDAAEQPEDAEEAEDEGTGEPAEEVESEVDASEELDVDEEEVATDDWRYVEEFDEPFVWEENAVRLSITGIGLTDATSDEVPTDVTDFLDDGAQVVVVLEMTASNDSGQTIDFYPDQGTIQLLREQVDADLWFSDSIAGFDWRDGVDDSGQVFWVLTNTSYEDAVQAGQLDYAASPVFSSEEFEEVAGSAELTITWNVS